ncbi:uncharacterized protein LOC126737284 [Anthonomus grandis grandis]|uniref:uncharacterized protein LOC126737284 n=1 Tax=Anthonomus grandis grandis TaxID=2921223 RepID=UPI00216696F3|nr:uncharacterized protein LOC126737284 [Anthonomus grandis grandis]
MECTAETSILELKEHRILRFYCEKCLQFETHTLLQNSIEDKIKIIESKDEIITLLKQKLTESESSRIPITTSSYSQIAQTEIKKSPKININLPGIIIKPKQKQTAEKTEKDIKEAIAPKDLRIAVKNTKKIKDSSILIQCCNKEHVDILKKEAESKLKNYEVQVTKLRLPRFKIIGCTTNLSEKEIENSIRKQNNFITEQNKLKITYNKKARNDKGKSIVFGECDPILFSKLIYEKKIFFGWQRYPVYEDLSIQRCFKCQQFYHKIENCPNEAVCEFCSNKHDVSECPKLQKKCVNCISANMKYKSNYNTVHEANNPECPSYQYQLNLLRTKIDYHG